MTACTCHDPVVRGHADPYCPATAVPPAGYSGAPGCTPGCRVQHAVPAPLEAAAAVDFDGIDGHPEPARHGRPGMTAEPIFERVWHDLASHVRHHGIPSQSATPSPGGTAMSLLADAAAEIDKGFQNARGWVSDMETHLPAVISEAQKLESSPIFQALEGITLPAGAEQMIANLIKDAATEFAKLDGTAETPPPAATTPDDTPAATAPADAQPAPAAS